MVTTAMGWPLLVTASPWMVATSRGAAEARMQTTAVLRTIGLQLLHRRRTVEAKNHIGSSISMCRLQLCIVEVLLKAREDCWFQHHRLPVPAFLHGIPAIAMAGCNIVSELEGHG